MLSSVMARDPTLDRQARTRGSSNGRTAGFGPADVGSIPTPRTNRIIEGLKQAIAGDFSRTTTTLRP